MAQRTVVFPLAPSNEEKETLQQTSNLYMQAFEACVQVAWSMDKLSKINLHKQTYYQLKSELGLKSQYLCSARNKAYENVKAMRALDAKGVKVSKPKINQIPIRLDSRTLSFDFKRNVASITTQSGRVKVPIYWHKHEKRYKDWECKAGEIGIDRFGRWVLRLVFEKKTKEHTRTGRVVGIDRGIKHPFVSSDNKFYGKRRWAEHERKRLSLMARLQSKGTKSAKRHLKKLSGRLRRFKENCDRILVREFFVTLLPGDTIVLENLTNIIKNCGVKVKARKPHRKNMNRWSFKRLENAIKYLAELMGIYVEYINPRYTSQICSRCDELKKANRKNQSTYKCLCGLQLNADLNASRNIKNIWCKANGFAFGQIVNLPIVAKNSFQLQAPSFRGE